MIHDAFAAERIERLSMPEPNTGCWLFIGSLGSNGYGKLKGVRARTTIMAHRYSWEAHNGPIPRGLFVLHRCDQPSCVNPDHLFLGTHVDNMTDMVKKGRQRQRPITPEKKAALLADCLVKSISVLVSEYSISNRTIRRYRKLAATPTPENPNG
jgi:hypothetical protein